jgi:hypothetical protein
MSTHIMLASVSACQSCARLDWLCIVLYVAVQSEIVGISQPGVCTCACLPVFTAIQHVLQFSAVVVGGGWSTSMCMAGCEMRRARETRAVKMRQTGEHVKRAASLLHHETGLSQFRDADVIQLACHVVRLATFDSHTCCLTPHTTSFDCEDLQHMLNCN